MDKIVIGFIPAYILFMMGLGVYLVFRRAMAIRSGTIPMSYFKSYQGDVPQELKVLSNCFDNQFQVPLLFSITCVSAVLFQVADGDMVGLCTAFFISRVWHAYIHLGSNNLRLRPLAFAVGPVVLIVMWGIILSQGHLGHIQ